MADPQWFPARNQVAVALFCEHDRYLCPVCAAAVFETPPYDLASGKPSFAFCPNCQVQCGYDDHIGPTAPAGTLERVWLELRVQFLKSAATKADCERIQAVGWPTEA